MKPQRIELPVLAAGTAFHSIIHCVPGHSFLPIPAALSQVAEKQFGNSDGCAPHWICRGDSNRLFRIPVLRGQWSEKWQQPINWLDRWLSCCSAISHSPLPQPLLSRLSGRHQGEKGTQPCLIMPRRRPLCDKEEAEDGPTSVHNSERLIVGGRMDVWWEILSVLAPVFGLALLGLIVLYALSRAPRRPQ